ncbi:MULTISPECIES: AAA family ATPase [unclassified Clostridium]|uniref:AAA family ATPase n=1 Tax=unclassified Clostridium TaxID=2614128 RepID=UPI0025BA5FB5|nr:MULTISPECIES: AAA family ATPase [unclassified Clostridium]
MPKLIMMIGLPASGKSTYAKEISKKENAVIISSDSMREELYENVNDTEHNTELFIEIHKRIKEHLKNDISVVYDATNINYKMRKAFLIELNKINCYKECYFMATPYERCLEQNNIRDRKVPEHVIKRMYKNIFIPQYYEGFDKIHIIKNFDPNDFDTHILFNGQNGLNNIVQDNPHHTLTIGRHCQKCSMICEELKNDFTLNIAALYHDIGKRFTKEFKNTKGENTDIAHYYQHHLVSAYDSLFYLQRVSQEDLLEIVKYITWHMQPFFLETEKAKNKFIKLVGKEFYDNLLILHKSDVLAK